jgi:O-antigen/teichoic acid export membrane protein
MPIGLLFIGDQFTDIVMLGFLSDSESVGEYGAAAKWVTLFIILARPIYMIFTPLIAGQFGMNQTEQVRSLYRAAIRWTLFLTFPVCVFLLLAREPLMLLFGKGFLQSGPAVLALLLLGNLSTIIVGNAGNLLTMCGHQYKELTCIGGSLALNILLNWWLIPIYGVYGAAVSTIVSNMVCDLGRLLIVHWYLGVHPFTRHYVAPLATGLILCLGMRFLPFTADLGILGKLVLALGAGCLVALSILALGLDSKDREIFLMLQKRFIKPGPYSTA